MLLLWTREKERKKKETHRPVYRVAAQLRTGWKLELRTCAAFCHFLARVFHFFGNQSHIYTFRDNINWSAYTSRHVFARTANPFWFHNLSACVALICLPCLEVESVPVNLLVRPVLSSPSAVAATPALQHLTSLLAKQTLHFDLCISTQETSSF